MSGKDAVARTEALPLVRDILASALRELGLRAGMTLIVHSSLSSLGWVCGGAQTVILALEDVLTSEGTLVMPEHSGDWSDPAEWRDPPVPEAWWPLIRTEMPLFDPDLTPSRGMGRIAETFRKQKGVLRSSHPQLSFAAWGRNRDYVLQDSHYDFAMNEKSPLGRIYELDGSVLLLGVGYSSNTSLHLAEYRLPRALCPLHRNGFPVPENSTGIWREFDDIDYNTDDFDELGADFELSLGSHADGAEPILSAGRVGAAACRLLRQRPLVDYAADWMKKHRQQAGTVPA